MDRLHGDLLDYLYSYARSSFIHIRRKYLRKKITDRLRKWAMLPEQRHYSIDSLELKSNLLCHVTSKNNVIATLKTLLLT